MHQAAFEWVRDCLTRIPPRKEVLEYGGRDINGTVRGLFNSGAVYLSIDIVPGPGVDRLADAATFRPEKAPDTIVCCEVLEHTARWVDIVKAAGRVLNPKTGVLILTTACHPRIPHSAIDGLGVRDGEYYGNVDPMELTNALEAAGFKQFEVDVLDQPGDLRAIAWKAEQD